MSHLLTFSLLLVLRDCIIAELSTINFQPQIPFSSLVCNTNIKFCRYNPLTPLIILQTHANFSLSSKSNIKSPATIGIGIRLSPSQLKDYLQGTQLMSRNLIDRNLKFTIINPARRCLLIPKDIIPSRIEPSAFDNTISRMQSILLDQYKWYDQPALRILFTKNRHLMLLKVLVDKHNLTISKCFRNQLSPNRDLWDVDFAVYTLPQKLYRLSTNYELIHSGEKFVVKFGAVRRYDIAALFLALVRPIGWHVSIVSAIMLGCLTICIFEYRQRSGFLTRSVGHLRVAEFLMRAQIDQCITNKQTAIILGMKDNLRFIYATYLFYCILISTAFKTNLILELMQPTATLSPETFQELSADPKGIYSFDRKRGQKMNVVTALEAELEKSQNPAIFKNLLQRYILKRVDDINDILKCKINFLEEADYLEMTFKILKRKYGLQGYKVGRDGLVNDIFWAVKYSEVSSGLVDTLRTISSSGMADHFR